MNATPHPDWYREVETLISENRLDDARRRLDDVPKKPLDAIDRAVLLSEIDQRESRYSAVAQYVLDMIIKCREEPDYREHIDRLPFLYLAISSAFLRLGRVQDAADYVDEALLLPGLEENPEAKARLLMTQGLILRRQGKLAAADQAFSEAAAIAAVTPRLAPRRSHIVLDQVAVRIYRADYDAAQRLIQEYLNDQIGAFERANFLTARAFLELNREDWPALSRALDLAKEYRDRGGPRNAVLLEEYSGVWELNQGALERAKVLLLSALKQARRIAPAGDLVAEASSWLAQAMLLDGAAQEALDYARDAVRIGEVADLPEFAAGLRVAGQCYDALGRREQALECFHRASVALRDTDLVGEIARLNSVMERLGYTPLAGDPRLINKERRRQYEVARARLHPTRAAAKLRRELNLSVDEGVVRRR